MARALVVKFSSPKNIIFEPFVGSGVIAHESLIAGRGIVCCDSNPYAVVLARANFSSYRSLTEALALAAHYLDGSTAVLKEVNLHDIPKWVQDFFHPETLGEIVPLIKVLKKHEQHFLLACLLGILHHERPGFLAYFASHAVPSVPAGSVSIAGCGCCISKRILIDDVS